VGAAIRARSRARARQNPRSAPLSLPPILGCDPGKELSFGFRDRVAVAISANAGIYAMPDLATPWPFGLGQTDVDTDALRALLGSPITVMAGAADVKTTGRFFPISMGSCPGSRFKPIGADGGGTGLQRADEIRAASPAKSR
jgi:hypothetical protein